LESGGGFGGPNIGRHAWSRDGLSWTYGNNTLTYNVTVHFTDGTTIDYGRRERPTLYFKPGKEKIPLLLVTGVQEKGNSKSYTLIQPIGQPAVPVPGIQEKDLIQPIQPLISQPYASSE